MIYQRKIYKKIKKYLNVKQTIVITGMRRVGKTTILKQILSEIKSKNKTYFDLEKLSDRSVFDQKNYDNILLDLERKGIDIKKKIYLAIDEIQFLPNITSVIKYLYDHYNIKFFLTGSSSYYLKNFFTQSLAGRKIIFELFPLDFGEFLIFKEVYFKEKNPFKEKFSEFEYERLKFYYEEFINFGGFPEIVLAKKQELKKELLNDIISSYINIDIKSLSDFRKDKEIYSLIKMLASRIGARLDYNKLASLVGLSRHTIEEYVDFFEKTYLIYRVPVYTRNTDREIVKAKKIYFCDNGLVDILAENSSGSKFENAFFNQIRHIGNVCYYALKNGNEIDFVLNKKIALEAKESPIKIDLNNLARLSKIAELKKYYLIGRKNVFGFNNYIWGGDVK
ncbi:ATP-binding protein [Patescibacteria group bacterium]|nr:ATP-binding protein [Patescibacteria group bacterium]MBU1934157.1 ATP-binding protein [Patescibacteria group bacterium]MBU2007527.1 ATP-binding protein [Patescibacteria group bacterium]MBU2233958.1 ATP-binding protein [Patescibacteria group bacterium]MBU2264426.1 ATP-binding protein [Patescibacteria group bacterium]